MVRVDTPRRAMTCAIAVMIGVSLGASCVAEPRQGNASRPNVLMIGIDDMNDFVNSLEGYAGTVHTPNIDGLARRGRLFTNAHTASPMCAPSRNALLLGQAPWSTGLYLNSHSWWANLPDAVVLPAHFKANGYHVAGAGKIFHQGPAFNHPDSWSEYPRLDYVYRNRWLPRNAPLNGLDTRQFPMYPTMDWGALESSNAVMYDERTTAFAVEFLGRRHTKPFFLAAGIFRPHIPWYAPQRFFDMYPVEDVVLPPSKADDLEDIPPAAFERWDLRSDLHSIDAAGKRSEAVRAYLANISYADDLVGQILDALADSAYADNTIVVLWSDHGWHLGEKGWWHKFTLWERSTRVPFIIAGPSVQQAGSPTSRPVSLLDIYPTLIDLCQLPGVDDLDGDTLLPLLRDPHAPRAEPALTTYQPGEFAVRSEHFRFIRYMDGSEELYDHRSDPHEWTNLAHDPAYVEIKAQHARWIPRTYAEEAPISRRTHRYDAGMRKWVLR